MGVYVNINGCRSRVEEIMWPSKPLHVAYNEPFLLCFCDRGIDVFDVKSGDWIQIIQFEKVNLRKFTLKKFFKLLIFL